MLKLIFYTALIFCSTLTYGQIKDSIASDSNKESSYHCVGCDHYLFSDKEIIKKEGEQHYHVLPDNNEERTTIYCASCNKNIGFFDKTRSEYQISLNHLKKSKKDAKYHCKKCNASFFRDKKLLRKDDQYAYFSDSIDKNKIAKQSYKTKKSKVLCAKCNMYLGEVNNYGSQPYGIKIKLSSILKKR